MSHVIYAYVGTVAGLRKDIARERSKYEYIKDNGIQCDQYAYEDFCADELNAY